MADRKKYRFIETLPSKGGLAAMRLAAVSFVLFVIDVAISFAQKGQAGSYIGGIAVTAMLLSIYGFYVGMKSFSEKGVSPRTSVVGSIGCGIMAILWLLLFLTGIG